MNVLRASGIAKLLKTYPNQRFVDILTACDNSSVIDALNKHSIKGPAIVPLQRIFLIASVYDIQIFPFWIPSKENIVTDAASRYNYKKRANLGLQVSQNLPRPAVLRWKMHSFFTTPLVSVHASFGLDV